MLDPERPCELTEVEPPRRVSAAVGSLALLTGLAVGAFATWALQVAYVRRTHVVELLTVAAIAAPIAWFFLEAGIRLVANKPSRCGSILALSSWWGLCVSCVAAALWVLVLGLRGNILAGLLGAIVFGSAAWHCRARIVKLKAKDAAYAAV